MSDSSKTLVLGTPEELWQPATRRGFLKLLGVGGTVVLLPSMFAACNSDKSTGIGSLGGGATLDLSTDTGILNYAYALEQLEAAFYVAAVGASSFGSLSAAEQELVADVRNHEVIHREFFKAVLGSSAIGALKTNSTTVTAALSSRANMLATARKLEDTGVAAYNGAGKYLKTADYLVVAGKIVSVEARHAAAFRDVLDSGTGRNFAGNDAVNAQGLDLKAEPSDVLAAVTATNLVSTTITVSSQPRTLAKTDNFLPS
ncbi:MAG TPA: ferritin-like domain-containing protein [Gemmatimonadaceae bacterium]|nr:ferritin-like domain-containing protein [Gemmatimonadaceae bacterium]